MLDALIIQQHRAADRFGGIFDIHNHIAAIEPVEFGGEGHIPSPLWGIGVIAQVAAFVVDNTGRGQTHAVKLRKRYAVACQKHIRERLQALKGFFQRQIGRKLAFHIIQPVAHKVKQGQPDASRPHGDAQQIAFAVEGEVLWLFAADIGRIALSAGAQKPAIAEKANGLHRGLTADSCFCRDVVGRIFSTITKHTQNLPTVFVFQIRWHGGGRLFYHTLASVFADHFHGENTPFFYPVATICVNGLICALPCTNQSNYTLSFVEKSRKKAAASHSRESVTFSP